MPSDPHKDQNILELSTRPAMVNPEGHAAPKDIEENSNGRLVAKFLQSFFDPRGVVIDR